MSDRIKEIRERVEKGGWYARWSQDDIAFMLKQLEAAQAELARLSAKVVVIGGMAHPATEALAESVERLKAQLADALSASKISAQAPDSRDPR